MVSSLEMMRGDGYGVTEKKRKKKKKKLIDICLNH